MFKTAVLASGSKGNCFLVKTDNVKILVDVGLSAKKIISLLQSIYLSHDKINALVISHEHNDHIGGAGVLARKLKIPLYISEKTFLARKQSLGQIKHGLVFFENGSAFEIGDLIISPFSSSHDVVESSNFVIAQKNNNDRKLAIVTDLGYPTRLTIQKLKGCTTIILESNHDEQMLLEGPYPWELKQRVKSREGHLSNNQAVGLISQVAHPNLSTIILAHLSEKNNTPELAYNTMKAFIDTINLPTQIIVASQYKPTKLIDI